MTLNGWFTFGPSFDSRTYPQITVVPVDIDKAPAPEYQVLQAPGHLGDIIVDNQRYPNVERTYCIMIQQNFDEVYKGVRRDLLSKTGYLRLADAWSPGEYFEAYISEPLEPTVSRNRQQGTVFVTFSRRPQRFLTSGEERIYFPETGTVNLYNPTGFAAEPIFHCTLNLDIDWPQYDLTFSLFRVQEYSGSAWEDMRIQFTNGRSTADAAKYVEIDARSQSFTTEIGIPAGTRIYYSTAVNKDIPTIKQSGFRVGYMSDRCNPATSYIIPRWWRL